MGLVDIRLIECGYTIDMRFISINVWLLCLLKRCLLSLLVT